MADSNGSQGVNSKKCSENLPYPQINTKVFPKLSLFVKKLTKKV